MALPLIRSIRVIHGQDSFVHKGYMSRLDWIEWIQVWFSEVIRVSARGLLRRDAIRIRCPDSLLSATGLDPASWFNMDDLDGLKTIIRGDARTVSQDTA